MELTVVRHLSREIEVGNGAWAVLVANEQIEKSHPLQRAFVFKARQTSAMSKRLQQALVEGRTFKELSPRLQTEARKSRFSFINRKDKKTLSSSQLTSRHLRMNGIRENSKDALLEGRQAIAAKHPLFPMSNFR